MLRWFSRYVLLTTMAVVLDAVPSNVSAGLPDAQLGDDCWPLDVTVLNLWQIYMEP